MRVLAFDTALGACSAAVLSVEHGRRTLARAYEARERGHAEALIPMIEAVMTEAGLDYSGLDRIALTTGPGTFTGCRIAVATARGLALAARLPVVSLTTLSVMDCVARARVSDVADEAMAIAVDARRGQVYFALHGPGGTPVAEIALLSLAEAAVRLADGTVVAGSGAALVAQAAQAHDRRLRPILPDLQPDAAVLAEMALTREPESRPVKPLYLRPPDAKPQPAPAAAARRPDGA